MPRSPPQPQYHKKEGGFGKQHDEQAMKEGGFGKSETEELFFYPVIKKDDNFDAEMASASSWEVRARQIRGSSANTPWFHAGRPDTPNDDL